MIELFHARLNDLKGEGSVHVHIHGHDVRSRGVFRPTEDDAARAEQLSAGQQATFVGTVTEEGGHSEIHRLPILIEELGTSAGRTLIKFRVIGSPWDGPALADPWSEAPAETEEQD